MSKFTSLTDLRALLADAEPENTAENTAPEKTGYDGKTYSLRVTTEKRSGTKIVTLVRGFQSRPGELDAIVAELKKNCGTGGRAIDNEIELQGDHRAKTSAYLQKRGYRVSR